MDATFTLLQQATFLASTCLNFEGSYLIEYVLPKLMDFCLVLGNIFFLALNFVQSFLSKSKYQKAIRTREDRTFEKKKFGFPTVVRNKIQVKQNEPIRKNPADHEDSAPRSI